MSAGVGHAASRPAAAAGAFLPARRHGGRPTGRRCFDVFAGLVYLALRSVGDVGARAVGGGRSRLVVLYYHAVPGGERARFARQLDVIRAGADAVVPADFCARVPPGRLLVAITFDDAFVSVIDNALPDLAARNMPATIFAPSGTLGARPSWQMEAAESDRLETVAQGDRLRDLPQDLVVIGAHSVTHPRLPEIDGTEAAAEIGGSKDALTALLGRDVTIFSFPYGEYDARTAELCRSAGFRFAFHTLPRTLDPADASLLRGRVRVDTHDWPLEFWLKLRGAYHWQSVPRECKRWLRQRAAARSHRAG